MKLRKEQFNEISNDEMKDINGGEILALIVGGAISCIVYEIGNDISVDLTGKTIGKNIADAIFPANN